jgi:hypothetical protein
VQVNDLKVAVAERYEVVFDFSQYAGQTLYLRNIQDAGGGEYPLAHDLFSRC